jgi:hypothetical protein
VIGWVQVQQHGVQLHGFFKRTQHDEDYEYFVGLAQQHCGSNSQQSQLASPGAANQQLHVSMEQHNNSSLQQQSMLQSGATDAEVISNGSESSTSGLCAVDLGAYELLLSHGVGVFASGISHQQFIDLTAGMPLDHNIS